jgi:hypothetical protein
VEVRVSKAIRAKLHRTELTLPSDALPAVCDAVLRSWYDSFLAERPVSGTLNDLNEVIKGAFQSMAIGGKIATSYTFRRSAMHRFIARYTDEEGIVSWDKVCVWSLHHTPKTLKAFYHLHVSDELA